MTPWSQFLPKVQLEVPLAPYPVLVDAVRDAAIEFCRVSQAWREMLETTMVSPDARDIELEHPDSGRIHRILWAKFGSDTVLAMPTHDELDAAYPDWRDEDSITGDPVAITLMGDDTLRLIRHPSTEDELAIRAVLKPSITSTGGPDALYLSHYEAIANGAKAKLMAVTKVPWTNPARAAQLDEAFTLYARSESIRVAKGGTRARIRSSLQYR